MKTTFLLLVTLLAAESAISQNTAASIFGKQSSPQTAAYLDSISSSRRSPVQVNISSPGFSSIEEARFALRNKLLEASQQCKPTNIPLDTRKETENEFLGYVIKRPDGKFDISTIDEGESSKVSADNKPDNAVESMHTHPWFFDWKDFTDLGPSGEDISIARKQGIPAYVLDCASGDVYGISQDGKAMKLECDETSGKCFAKRLRIREYDDLPIIGREYSQQIANDRYQDVQQKQKQMTGTSSPIHPDSRM